jgi:hypothetical protein
LQWFVRKPQRIYRLLKNKNNTGTSQINDVDKEVFLITAGGHFHKKILVELFASARLNPHISYFL